MASDTPIPGRCGAQCLDKVGIEVHSAAVDAPDDLDLDAVGRTDEDGRWVFTDPPVEAVILADGDHLDEFEPDYLTVVTALRNGANTHAVRLGAPHDVRKSESSSAAHQNPEGSEDVEVRIQDEDPYVTNRDTDLRGYCERYPMDSGRCYVHGGKSGPPEGNTNRMTHGLRAKRSNYYQSLDEEDKLFVEALVDSWLEDAPFGRDMGAKVTEVYRVAIDQHRLWNALDEYEGKGMVYEQVIDVDEQGNPITADQENPVNLPYSRLDRDHITKLEKLEILDGDDDSTEVTISLAKKLSGVSEEG